MGVILLLFGIVVQPSIGLSTDDDTTPPVTSIKFYGIMSENGWYIDSVFVELTAKDDMSGVNTTFYRINDGEWEIFIIDVVGDIHIEDDGIYIIEFYSVDNAGNTEEVKSAELKIDQRDPFIHVDVEKLEKNKWKFIATCFDATSGMDRVEFYYDDELMFTDYEEPYEWIWNETKEIGNIIYDSGFNILDFSVFAYDKAGNKAYPVFDTPDIVIGIIFNPQFSEYSVSFFAVIVWVNYNEFVKFEKLTYSTIGSGGYIGKFFILASFQYGWPVV